MTSRLTDEQVNEIYEAVEPADDAGVELIECEGYYLGPDPATWSPNNDAHEVCLERLPDGTYMVRDRYAYSTSAADEGFTRHDSLDDAQADWTERYALLLMEVLETVQHHEDADVDNEATAEWRETLQSMGLEGIPANTDLTRWFALGWTLAQVRLAILAGSTLAECSGLDPAEHESQWAVLAGLRA